MSVVLLRASEEPAPLRDFTPAIRTPEQFAIARARVDDLAQNLAAGDMGDQLAIVRELRDLRCALESSPFYMLDGYIRRRGWTPKVVH